MPDGEALAWKMRPDVGDDALMLKLLDDEVTLFVRVNVRRMGDLEAKPGELKSNVFRPSPQPYCPFIVGRSKRIEPKQWGVDGLFGTLERQSPEADVVPPPRTVANRLLKTDVLSTAEQIECAERSARVRPVQDEGTDHSPGTSEP